MICRKMPAIDGVLPLCQKLDLFKSFLLAALVAGLGAIAVWAQPPDKDNAERGSVSTSRETSKPELKEAYKKWLNNDVAYIITERGKKGL